MNCKETNTNIVQYSPYELIPDEELVLVKGNTTLQADLKKLFRDKEFNKAQYALFEGLFHYHFLNKKNLSRHMNWRLRDGKWPNYDNLLKGLCADGIVMRYKYGKTNLYTLAPYCREYMQSRIDPNHHLIQKIPGLNPADVLECAALAQWHIGLLSGERAVRTFFYETIKIKGKEVFLPSYIELKRDVYTFHVLSVCLPKASDSTIGLFATLNNITNMLKEKKGGSRHRYIVVAVASSLDQITKTTELLKQYDEYKNLSPYFVLEQNTVFTTGLDLLYYYDYDLDGSGILKTISAL